MGLRGIVNNHVTVSEEPVYHCGVGYITLDELEAVLRQTLKGRQVVGTSQFVQHRDPVVQVLQHLMDKIGTNARGVRG